MLEKKDNVWEPHSPSQRKKNLFFFFVNRNNRVYVISELGLLWIYQKKFLLIMWHEYLYSALLYANFNTESDRNGNFSSRMWIKDHLINPQCSWKKKKKTYLTQSVLSLMRDLAWFVLHDLHGCPDKWICMIKLGCFHVCRPPYFACHNQFGLIYDPLLWTE